MKRWLFSVLLVIGLASLGIADSNPSLSASGGTLTYGAGSVTVKGTLQTISTGTLTGFAASQNACSLSAIFAGTDACEYVYYPGTGTALLHSTSLETASPYVIGIVTTDASGNILSVSDSTLVRLQPGILAENPLSLISYVNCKTTSVCSWTYANNHVLVSGTTSLSSGTVTITGLNFFNANYRCFGADNTASNIVRFSNKQTTQVTINGTSTDSIDWFCVGKSN